MPMNKTEIKKELKLTKKEIENTVNSMEEEFRKDTEEFRKDLALFEFGRLQQQFIRLSSLIGMLDGNK